MEPVYRFSTDAGDIFICQTSDGRFHPAWKSESLGSYDTAQAAAEAAAFGATFTPSDGTNLDSLGISPELERWTPIRPTAR